MKRAAVTASGFGGHAPELAERVERASTEFTGLFTALGPRAPVADEFADPVPFDPLLC